MQMRIQNTKLRCERGEGEKSRLRVDEEEQFQISSAVEGRRGRR